MNIQIDPIVCIFRFGLRFKNTKQKDDSGVPQFACCGLSHRIDLNPTRFVHLFSLNGLGLRQIWIAGPIILK